MSWQLELVWHFWWDFFAIFHHSNLRISPIIGYTSEKLSISPENQWLVQMSHFLLSPGFSVFFLGEKNQSLHFGEKIGVCNK